MLAYIWEGYILHFGIHIDLVFVCLNDRMCVVSSNELLCQFPFDINMFMWNETATLFYNWHHLAFLRMCFSGSYTVDTATY
jgi:hypothetical protein